MSIGNIKDYTPNYKFIIPKFDTATWHDYIESNFRSIDALLYNIFVVNGYKGEWTNSTLYEVGSVVFIGDDNGDFTGKLFKVLVEHTTPNSGNFKTFYENNPDKYEQFADFDAAERAAQLAKDWANKLGDTVDGIEYSSKYYAQLAQQTVNSKANNNEVVHLSDTETITGSKTFNAQPQFASGQGIRFNTSSNDEYYVMRSSGSPALGCSFLLNNNTTASAFNISPTKIIIGSNTILPNTITPATSDNSTRIATTAYVKSQGYATDIDVMKTTGNQTIGGIKTFTSNPAIQNTAPALYLNSMDVIKGTAPDETQYAGITFRDSTGNIKGSLARILTGYMTNKESFISLYAYKCDATPATEAGLVGSSVTMHYPATGNPYATAPASDIVDSVLTTVNKSKASNGYFQLGNGLIINWGYYNSGAQSGTINFSKKYNSYSRVTATSTYAFGDSPWGVNVTNTTVNGFDWFQVHNQPFWWIAIGY